MTKTIMTIIRRDESAPGACYSMLFDSEGQAMQYADEVIDGEFVVVVTSDDDAVVRRVGGKWDV